MVVTLNRLKENGAYAYETIFLTQLKSYSFGQMSSNDFILYAPTVEKNHCIFHNQPNGLFVEVVKSSSGVLIVNGKIYLSSSVVRLNNNDIVNIGLLLKYKIKLKTAIPIADNFDYDYVNNEIDEENGLPYQNVNDSNIENLENEATLSAETFHSEISLKVEENLSEEIESGLSLQEIDAALQIEKGKEENELENSLSIDSSALKTVSYHSPSESKSHEFATETASDSLLRTYLPDSLSEKEPLSDSLPEKVPLSDSSTDDKLFSNSSSKEKNLSSTQHPLLLLNNKVLCLKLKKLSPVFLEQKTNHQRLQTHSVYQSTEGSFGCYHCGKKFKRKTNIRQHILTVHSEEKQTCKICKKIFKCKFYLKQHMVLHSTEKRYKCSLCEKGFLCKPYLQRHMLFHSTEIDFKCSICEKVFKCKKYLELHIVTHSTERNFKCSICEKAFRCKKYLEIHMLSHSTERNFNCLHCNKGFVRKCDLQKHMMAHLKERNFKCSLCKKDFNQKKHLQVHMLTHSTERNFKCSLCKKDFRRKHDLQQHILTHSTEKQFKCSNCFDCFKSSKYLTKHVRKWHAKERLFNCKFCQKQFFERKKCEDHQRIHTATLSAETFQSEISQKVKENSSKEIESVLSLQEIDAAMQIEIVKKENELENSLFFDSSSVKTEFYHSPSESKSHEFATEAASDFLIRNYLTDSLSEKEPLSDFLPEKQRLQTHSVYHSTERPFGCNHCGKRFKRKADVRWHIIRVHSEEKYTCKICKKAFGCIAYLKQHMLCHSTERKFKCSLCEKDFGRKKFLDQHMFTHSTEKKFKCSFCEKRFKCKSHLHRHMLIHSTEKKFKCSICEKGFGTKQHMQQHMLVHSTEKQFKCSNCFDCFKSSKYLIKHVRKWHAKE